MKVENSTQVAVTPIRNERVGEQAATARESQAPETTAKPQARKDSVSLSSAVDRLNKANEFLKDLPDTRPDRVQELKGKIETGEYNVKSKDVAAKMLSVMSNGYAG